MVILAAVALIVGIGCLLLGRYAQNRGKQLTEWPSYSVGIIGVMVSILALANLSPATNTGPSPGPSAPPNAPTTPGPSTPVDTPTTPGPSTPTNTPPPQTEYYLSDYDP